MNIPIKSVSISGIIWGEVEENRISFSIEGMDKGVHFTIAWNKETSDTNLHITRNTGDGSNKPYIRIIEIDKASRDKMEALIPTILAGKMFRLLSFKKYSHKERKNIRLLFQDELENDSGLSDVVEYMGSAWNDASKIKKRNRLIVSDKFQKVIYGLKDSNSIKKLLLRSMRALKKNSFDSPAWRVGYFLKGGEITPFISINGKCFAIKKITIYDLLNLFAKKDAEKLADYVYESLEFIKTAKSWQETLPYNKPFTLHVEESGQIIFRRSGEEKTTD